MNNIYLTTRVSGTITIASNSKIVVEKNSYVLASINAEDYMVDDCFYLDDCNFEKCRSLFFAKNESDIELCAKKNGIIGGNGAAWTSFDKYVSRPGLIKLVNCKNIYIHDLLLIDSPYWGIWLHNCENVIIENVRIISRWGKSNVGIEVDCSRNVTISNCYIDTKDDCIDVKTTKNIVASNIVIKDSLLSSRCSAFRIGTETVGDISEVSFVNNTIEKSLVYGIKIFATDGAKVSNIEIDNVTMVNVTGGIIISNGTRMKRYFREETDSTFSSISDIRISNIKVEINPQEIFIKGKVGEGVNMIIGTEGNPIENIEFNNCEFQMPGGFGIKDYAFLPFELSGQFPEYYEFGVAPASGVYVYRVNNVMFKNVKIVLKKEDSRDLYVSLFSENIKIIN